MGDGGKKGANPDGIPWVSSWGQGVKVLELLMIALPIGGDKRTQIVSVV